MDVEKTTDYAPISGRPPGPKSSLFKTIARMRGNTNRLQGVLQARRLYGDIVYSKIGPLNSYMLLRPEFVYHVLVTNQKNYIKGMGYNSLRMLMGTGLLTSDGDLWKRQRRLMSPHFTPIATLDFSDLMSETIQHMLARWDVAAQRAETLNIDLEMMHLTMSIIGRAMFSFDLGGQPTEAGHAMDEAFAFIPKRSANPFVPMWLPLPAHRHFAQNLKAIDKFIYDQIAEGRRNPDRENFLSVMLKVQDSETGQGMDDRQLRDEVITLFFAGFETTARTLTWGWYLLNRHPEALEKLAAEARRVLPSGSPASSADLERLTYTRMVVDETLRIYPPTAMLARQNIAEDQIGGYRIPAMSLVSLSPYVVHRDADYWPDAERFDPERFGPEAVAARPKFAYIPFAAGPRVCLGNSFALMEMVYAFAMAAFRFNLKQVPDEVIGATLSGTIQPTSPLMMQITRR